jgi:predicted RND superfamily exporter protein
LLRHRVHALGIGTAVTAGCLILALGLRFDFNFQDYFPENDPVRDAYREMLADFPAESSEVAIILSDSSLFSNERISAVVELTDDLRGAHFFESAVSAVDLPPRVFGRAAAHYERFVAGGDFAPNAYAWLRAEMMRNPLVGGQLLLERDGMPVFVIRAVLKPQFETDVGRAEVRRELLRVLNRHETSFAHILVSGFSSIRADFAVALKREQRVLLPAVVATLLIVTMLLMGRTWLASIPVLMSLVAVTWTLAWMALGDSSFTILTTATPLLILIVGISDAQHIFHAIREELRCGRGREEAVVRSFGHLGRSCFLTSATTAIGFAGLTVTNLPVLNEFGFYTSLGVMTNYVVTMTMLPVVLASLPLDQLTFGASRGRSASACDRVSGVARTWRRSPRLNLSLAILAIAVSMGSLRLTEDTRVYQGLAERNWLQQRIVGAEEILGGLLPFGVVVAAESEDQLTSGRTLASVASVQRFLESRDDVVGSAFSVVDIVRWLRYAAGQDPDSVDWSRLSSASMRNRLERLRETDSSLVDGMVNFDRRRLLIRCRIRDVGSRRLRPFLVALREHVEQQDETLAWQASGLPTLSLRLSEKVNFYIIATFSVTFLIIFLGFAIGFRSFLLAAACIVPNIIPLACILGFIGWVGIPLQPAIVIVFSIVYGISVNDTIHFVNRFIIEQRDGENDPVDRTTEIVAMPMVTSSAILIVGFGVLLFSELLGLFYLGLLLAVGIVSALLADLVMLPTLLNKILRRGAN